MDYIEFLKKKIELAVDSGFEVDKARINQALKPQEELERIRQDNQITGQDIDWTGGEDDELDEEDDSPEEKEGEENQDPDDSKSGKAPDPGDKE